MVACLTFQGFRPGGPGEAEFVAIVRQWWLQDSRLETFQDVMKDLWEWEDNEEGRPPRLGSGLPDIARANYTVIDGVMGDRVE